MIFVLKGEYDEIEGELRVVLLLDLGCNIIIFWLDELFDEYLKLSMCLYISDSNVDFYWDFVDFVFRYGLLFDLNLYGFKICNVLWLLCVILEYIVEYGMLIYFDELI